MPNNNNNPHTRKRIEPSTFSPPFKLTIHFTYGTQITHLGIKEFLINGLFKYIPNRLIKKHFDINRQPWNLKNSFFFTV